MLDAVMLSSKAQLLLIYCSQIFAHRAKIWEKESFGHLAAAAVEF
jgi:hypothetical protein